MLNPCQITDESFLMKSQTWRDVCALLAHASEVSFERNRVGSTKLETVREWRNGTAQGLNGFSGVWAAFPGAELPKKLVQLCSLVPSPGWPQRGSTALANDSCFGGWQILLHHERRVEMEKRGKERIKRFPLFHREPEPIYRIREGINLSWIHGLLIEADMESQAVV